MFLQALTDTPSLVVLGLVLVMLAIGGWWTSQAYSRVAELGGATKVLRSIGLELDEAHPIRRRLESTRADNISLEELASLLSNHKEAADLVEALLALQVSMRWIERFAQMSIHLGILGTVVALVGTDPSDIEVFRASLPRALGTTFWGLIGALGLSTLAGYAESVEEKAARELRKALVPVPRAKEVAE